MGSFTVIQALWGFLSNILWVSKIAFETDQSAIRVGPECSQGFIFLLRSQTARFWHPIFILWCPAN